MIPEFWKTKKAGIQKFSEISKKIFGPLFMVFTQFLHRYRDPSQQDGEPIHIDNEADRLTTLNDDEDENETQTKMYEDHNEFLHGKKRRGKSHQIISSKFIKKYLYVAKMQSPKLTKVSAPPS